MNPANHREFLPCGICSNGCTMSMDFLANGQVEIDGHKCQKGYQKATRFLFDKPQFQPKEKKPSPQFSQDYLLQVLSHWDLDGVQILSKQIIQGSPERSLFRTLILSHEKLYLLESLKEKSARQSQIIQGVLDSMMEEDKSVLAPKKTKYAESLLEKGGEFWRLTPWIKHQPLDRSEYWKNPRMGAKLGQLLNSLVTLQEPELPRFDFGFYIKDLLAQLKIDHPLAYRGVAAVLETMGDWEGFLRDLPEVFNHRDPHPLNALWKGEQLLALIDWEFASLAPIFYDGALVMGCVGSESPEALMAPFNTAFLGELRHPLFLEHLENLPDLLVLLRFPWLGEAARHQDNQWLQSEVQYIRNLSSLRSQLVIWIHGSQKKS